MSLLSSMHIISEVDTVNILKKDALQLSTAKDFVTLNKLEYYVCCNTWLLLVKDYSSYGYLVLADKIKRVGLVATIREAQESADELINGLPISSSLFRSIYNDVQQSPSRVTVPHVHNDMTVGEGALATMLMLLRFPKRLSPLKADKVQADSIKEFIAVENRSKLLQRRGYSSYLLLKCRQVSQDFMHWDRLVAEIKESLANYQLSFTTGVGFDSRASLGSKLQAVAKSLPEAFPNVLGIPYAGVYPDQDVRFWGNMEEVRLVRVAPVPKSYKAARIIAMEDTARQALANEVGKIIDRYLPKSIPLHDQTVNQRLAYLGSLDGSLATIDLSHASDCITKVLFWEILPKNFTKVIYPLLGTHTSIDGKERTMQQMSTSGNSLTFILESIIFNIIELVSYDMYKLFVGEDLPRVAHVGGEELVIPTSYGDDQVVDARVAELHIQVLEALGFVVNESKSYYTGRYRESCGEEYLEGINISSYYFPRFPLEGTVEKFSPKTRRDSFTGVYISTLTSCISLQHRLYGVSLGAAFFLSVLVKSNSPKMTTSIQDSLHEDLWAYESIHKTRILGRYTIEEESDKDFPSHRHRVFKKLDVEPSEYQERYYKYLPGVRYNVKKEPDDMSVRLFNLYRYMQFLKYGPKYSDPLLELLHVSDKPLSMEQCFGEPEIFWSFKEVMPE